jgi:hypothetical protein
MAHRRKRSSTSRTWGGEKLLESDTDFSQARDRDRRRRRLFWLYTFHAIAQAPPGDGTGFQWLAVIPLGAIFAMFFLPVWLFVAIGRLPRLTTALGCVG